LTLNYFGQGALLIAQPAALDNPFYLLAPDWALYPLVALATAATVIASQATISGTYSLTKASHSARLPAPDGRQADVRPRARPDLYPCANWLLFVVIIAAVPGLRQLDQARVRLRLSPSAEPCSRRRSSLSS
jgi:KUP system potassium uptake protein